VGGEGGDRITGGLGSDDMTGGSDADAFVFETLDDTPTGNTRDRIEDFTPGEDVIEILPALGFTFLGEGAFSATGAAEINYEHSGSNTIVGIDGDGDGLAEAKIALVGTLTLSEADFAIA
jgi:Ca2+-binding RTX toxin-like protein